MGVEMESFMPIVPASRFDQAIIAVLRRVFPHRWWFQVGKHVYVLRMPAE